MPDQLTDDGQRQANKLTDKIIMGTLLVILFGWSYALMWNAITVHTVESGELTAIAVDIGPSALYGVVMLFVTALVHGVMNFLYTLQYGY